MLRRALRLRRRRSSEETYGRADLTRIDYTDPDDIFIVGYPKSGNTWMQNLVASVVFWNDPRLTPASLIQDLVPDVHSQRDYLRYRTPMFFKTHHLPRPEYRRVIYLVRDGRDAMVSYFHFLGAINKSDPDFLEMVSLGEGLFPCRWHEHVEAWMANPFGAQMMMISYESLKEKPIDKLQELCSFARLERSRDFLEAVVRNCSFEVMREKETKFGWDDNGAWPKDKFFVRRGTIGSYRDEMPPAVLASFTEQSSNALRLLGISNQFTNGPFDYD